MKKSIILSICLLCSTINLVNATELNRATQLDSRGGV